MSDTAHIRADVAALPLGECSADALLCDPPYGLSFMGHGWDKSVPGVEVWREVYRVLKPGAFGLVFGGTRTFPFLALALIEAGFELRDTLCWLYGSGFPKSVAIGKAIDRAAGAEREVVGKGSSGSTAIWSDGGMGEFDLTAPATPEAARWEGYGTALKPAWEPILLIRKPPEGTNADNAFKWGAGALNIDGARVGIEQARARSSNADGITRRSMAFWMKEFAGNPTAGRWPANLVLDESAAEVLDAQGESSRFFYCAKASPAERNAGLEGLEWRSPGEVTGGREDGSAGLDSPRAGAGRTSGNRNYHPTLKPINLCRWLATLLLPPERETPRTLLVPFAGSGSEMIGAHLAGWDRILGIELDPEYIEIQRRRCEWWRQFPPGADVGRALEIGETQQAEAGAGQLTLEGA